MAPAIQGLDGAERRETHGAWVVLAGDRAYKIKKPVRFSFLDYSTLESRLAACRREVELNAPLAPETYLGVRALVRGDGGALRLGGAGEDEDAVEYAVEMRRFDERLTMAALLEAGRLSEEQVDAVARRLSAFHASAERCEGGGAMPFGDRLRRDLDDLEALGACPAAWRRCAAGLIRRVGPELDRRAAAGLHRDGHGDLRAEHVVLEEPLLIVDRIEFDDELRRGDVAADLAFLAMDLERLGARWAAERLVAAYAAAGGDPGERRLRAGWSWQRALVRLKIALLSGDDAAARRLHALGERLAWRTRTPDVLLVSGPPASGKSTIAAALSETMGVPAVSSDVLRKSAGPPSYDAAETERTYRTLGHAAVEALLHAPGVIIDATARTPRLRELLVAELRPRRVAVVWCEADVDLLRRRAAERMTRPGTISDAGPDVAAALAAEAEPPDGACRVETDRPVDEVLDAVAAWLDGDS